MKKTVPALLGLMLLTVFAPPIATAADEWKFAVTPYLWGAGINGTATVGLHEADVEKSFSDILTWSASAYLGWRFNDLVSAWAGYKHLFVEREDDRENSVDLAFSGPVLGVAFTF